MPTDVINPAINSHIVRLTISRVDSCTDAAAQHLHRLVIIIDFKRIGAIRPDAKQVIFPLRLIGSKENTTLAALIDGHLHLIDKVTEIGGIRIAGL